MGNLRMNADQISYKGGNKPMSVEEAIKNAGNIGLAHTADIAPDFSTETSYSAGDFVYHNGSLYVFTANHAAGAWSTDDTQAVTVGGEIATLSGDAADLNINKANQITIAPFFNAEESYDPGDLVYYNGLSFRCVNAHEGAWDFDDFAATTISNELSSLESGLTNLNDENIVYHKRYDGGDLWDGDTLTFNNIKASSNIVYHFIAFNSGASGTPESAYLIVKSTGVQVYGKVGTFTTAYDAEHETLTITLPSSTYWDYRFEVAARRNG